MYDGKLPFTGASGIAVGGVLLDQMWLLGVALGLVALGAVLVRMGWRRGKDASQA